MADISAEIEAFQNAIYGEEVRGSMISVVEKINDVVEDTEATVDSFETNITAAITAANEAAMNASSKATVANTAASSANAAADVATSAASDANSAAENATAKATAASNLIAQAQSSEQARVTAENERRTAETARASAESARANAETNRASNEVTRQDNETARNSAEATRVTAESGRASNETQRNNAETNRNVAETNRASAFRAIQDAWQDMEQQVLPPATTSTLGGIIVGDGLTVQSDGTLSFEAGDVLTKAEAAETYATITTVDGKSDVGHVHSTADLTSGTLPVNRGGTGVTTAAAERERLGLGSTTDALPVANGGTGAATASGALANLGAYSSSEVDTAIANLQSAILNAQALLGAIGTVPIANGGTGATTAAGAKAAIVDGQALAPASVAATGAVSGSSISDGVGTLAQLRDRFTFGDDYTVHFYDTAAGALRLGLSASSSGQCNIMFTRTGLTVNYKAPESSTWKTATLVTW